MNRFKEGDWVEVSDGRVGMVRGETPKKAIIQFGSDGPFELHWKGWLLPADPPEGFS
jgi:hypothetical protein